LRRILPDGGKVTFPVPVHAGKILKTGTLKGILRLANISTEELVELIK
jgi:predicted RNA binding protein YcfA (HicA-like mRNA interferase family)